MEIQITVFFLKFLGTFTLVIGLSFLNKKNYEKFVELEKNQNLFLGMITLMICMPIVLLHNIWTSPWEILISLIGWGGVLKAIGRFDIIPKIREYRINQIEDTSYKVSAFFTIVFGLIMLYGGFSY